ncbi:MAG: M23 family metallopeptidase [Clostridia bacterium]|nr:M23 family metallopeptidase [Clostridia bacterium]
MWKKWKESEFFRKMKQIRVNRAVYLSAVVILTALAVVLAITAVSNRAHRNDAGGTDSGNTTLNPPATEPGTTEPPTDTTPDRPTDDKIPELALPTQGKLEQKHSVDVQVFNPTMNDYRVHLGIDIATDEKAPVCAVAAGTVSQIWEDPMMGWCVALEHTGDCVTVYKNLAKDLAQGLATGQTVQQGQLLGYVGDSAMMEIAQEPHLHMEMTVGGLQVDPLEYFSAAVIATLTQDTAFENASGK